MKNFSKGLVALMICGALNFGLTNDAQATDLPVNLSGTKSQELASGFTPRREPPPRRDSWGHRPPPPPSHHDYRDDYYPPPRGHRAPPPPPPEHRW